MDKIEKMFDELEPYITKTANAMLGQVKPIMTIVYDEKGEYASMILAEAVVRMMLTVQMSLTYNNAETLEEKLKITKQIVKEYMKTVRVENFKQVD